MLVFSKWPSVRNVGLVADRLRARGLRSVLVSCLPDDRNRDRCDDHLVFDWDSEDVAALVARLDRRGIEPVAVVNMVEPLIPWQTAVVTHYGLPGPRAGLDVLASKYLVRERMRTLGLSAVRFSDDLAAVDFFPAIVKPSRESAASWLVYRVNDPEALLAHRRLLAELGETGTEMIAEEYLPGIEFSVDGLVVGGRFHPVLAVEKPEHDEIRHHDAGLRIHPPQQDHVREGVRVLSATIGALCADLGLDQLWLHVEGRATPDGRTELVEINPRPGGGMYPTVIRESSGIDPFETVVSMSLGDFTVPAERPDPLRALPIIGWVDLEAEELGTVDVRTTEDDLRALAGVIDAEVVDGYRVTSLEKENYFLRFVITADSEAQLRARTATVLSTLDFRIAPRRPEE
ncbi:acetyl-CoA carboxylase biotin carboxylase subunit family protein [Kitasatospora sp. NPDC091335]|uniref:ATP-grasp domain-containing protein n=1 Tax=Kitasatospora sp. NPDC091335 TaxID=3364085 RepID=UPI00380C203E